MRQRSPQMGNGGGSQSNGLEREVWLDFFNTASDRILYSDEQVVIISDRTPRASTHLLVLPRYVHISGTEALRSDHIPLLLHMKEVGDRVCAERSCARQDSEDTQAPRVVGFHRKPLRSVDHLHLHVMQPPFTPKWQRIRFSEPPQFLPLAFIRLSSMIEKLRQRQRLSLDYQ
jgi:sulfate adenylyltransferase (ADP) / adenylylsulfatase